jgi:hypothetical protein
MPAIPNLILKKLYVKSSLHNTAEGCEFSLKNVVDSGTVTRFYDLEVDGTVYGVGRLVVHLADSGSKAATAISPAAPLSLPAGVAITLSLRDVTLTPGRHQIRVRFETQELGELRGPGVRGELVRQPAPWTAHQGRHSGRRQHRL